MGDISPVHLRETPLVTIELDEQESRDLQAGLQGLNPGGSAFRIALHKVHRPGAVASRLLDRFSGAGWLTMSNVELHVAMNAVGSNNLDLAYRLRDAARDLERVDAAAHPTDYRGPGWDDAREQAVRKAGNACEECGETGLLHVHHLIRYRHFNTPSEANAQENLQVLCASCHGAAEAE